MLRRPLMVLVSILILAASTPVGAAWMALGASDGLGPGLARAIFEDSEGVVWIGGQGVSRYDGLQTTLEYLRVGGSDEVIGIDVDFEGRMWAIFRRASSLAEPEGAPDPEGPLVRVREGGKWTRPSPLPEFPAGSSRARALLVDLQGHVWIATDAGVSTFDGTRWTTLAPGTLPGYSVGSTKALLEDREGRIHVLGTRTVSTRSGVEWSSRSLPPFAPEVEATCMAQDSSGALWFGLSNSQLVHESGGMMTLLDYPEGESGIRPRLTNAIACDRWGVLWFATRGGLASLAPSGSWRVFSPGNGPPDFNTLSLLAAADGSVWCGQLYAGVHRYDQTEFRSYFYPDDLPANFVQFVAEDPRDGAIWFSTYWGGVHRFRGEPTDSLRSFGRDALGFDHAQWIHFDQRGDLWVGSLDGGVAVSRDRGTFVNLNPSNSGLAGPVVRAVFEDVGSGSLLFGTNRGVTAFNPADSSWVTFASGSPIPPGEVSGIRVDPEGNWWVAVDGGGLVRRHPDGRWTNESPQIGISSPRLISLDRGPDGSLWVGSAYDGAARRGTDGRWENFTEQDGLTSNIVSSVFLDREGVAWVSTSASGVSILRDGMWTSLLIGQGLASDLISSVFQSGSGDLWIACSAGLTRYTPDRVAPRTVVTARMPAVSGSRGAAVQFRPAFKEPLEGIVYQASLDPGPWGPWSAANTWSDSLLGDGAHVLHIQARDAAGNTEPRRVEVRFEIDATPPQPVLAGPAFGEVVRGPMAISGIAVDARRRSVHLEYRPSGASSWLPLLTDEQLTLDSARGDTLGIFDTTPLADGPYELRLGIRDSLGLEGWAPGRFVVDNREPYEDVTAPTRILTKSGGEVFTLDGAFHAFFPAGAFDQDAVVQVDVLSPGTEEDSGLRPGARLASRIYGLSWPPARLSKPFRIAVQPDTLPEGTGTLGLYLRPGSGEWIAVGGTSELRDGRTVVSALVSEPGSYALLHEANGREAPLLAGGTAGPMFSPRILRLRASGGAREVGIGFSLTVPAAVHVGIYNRAGRRVRGLASGAPMREGVNLVRWDGRDDDGRDVPEGLYLVSIRGTTFQLQGTLAVLQ